MILVRLTRLPLRHSTVPRGLLLIPKPHFSTTQIKKNQWLLNTPSVVVEPADEEEISSQSKRKQFDRAKFEVDFNESYTIYQELVQKVLLKQYADIVPILSNYKKKKKLLSNPHLLSFISLLLLVKDKNLKGIAYEVFLLYSYEILTDIKGYPNNLLEILLDVVYYYKDNTNFDVLFSQYLNSPILNERILEKALNLYIDNSNIELAKQLLYQVITYYRQNEIEVSPKVLEVFLRKMIQNNATYKNIEFGYNIWAQQKLPVTSTINDLMLIALTKSHHQDKLHTFIEHLSINDSKVLEFNDFLLNANKLSMDELKQRLFELIPKFQGEETHFHSRIIELVDNIPFLVDELSPSFKSVSSLYLMLADKISLTTNVDQVAAFIENRVIPRGVFNHRFLKQFCDAYITNFPDTAKQINGAYQVFLSTNFDSRTVSWYPELSDIKFYKYKQDYKLIKPSQIKVMELLGKINKLGLSLQERLQLLSNNLSRLGVESDELIYKYLLSNYEKPSYKRPSDLVVAEKNLLNLASPESKLKTDLAILKKHVQLEFDNVSTDPVTRVNRQREMIREFIAVNADSLTKKPLCDLCDIYITIKDFDISEKILDQVNELHDQEAVKDGKFEEINYDNLIIARMEFKNLILSHNYPQIIEKILKFKKRDDIKLRRFFIKLLKRDLQYLKKYMVRLQQKEMKTVTEVKETLVVEKLCIYLEDFIRELDVDLKEQTNALIKNFEAKLLKYKDHCK